jgi:hypothetical protein
MTRDEWLKFDWICEPAEVMRPLPPVETEHGPIEYKTHVEQGTLCVQTSSGWVFTDVSMLNRMRNEYLIRGTAQNLADFSEGDRAGVSASAMLPIILAEVARRDQAREAASKPRKTGHVRLRNRTRAEVVEVWEGNPTLRKSNIETAKALLRRWRDKGETPLPTARSVAGWIAALDWSE